MKKFIYYSTIFSICTEAFITRFIIDLKLFYLFVFVNFFLIVIFNKLKFSKSLLLVYSYLLFSGILSVALQTNQLVNVIAQLLGIVCVSLYFFNFYKLFHEDIFKIFKDYIYLCFGLALIGFPLLVYNQIAGDGLAFHSILNEPAHYCTFVLPAFYYSFKDKTYPRYVFMVILMSIFLSGSSLGMIGLALSIILIPKKIKFSKVVFPIIVSVAAMITLYNFHEGFRIRTDDTFKSLTSNDLSGANLSTYALLSNLFVTFQSVSHNPLLGSGLGSHELSHNKYIGNIDGIADFEQNLNLNSKDANSLFLRILSELGLFGAIGMVFFIIKNYTKKSLNNHSVFISRAILIYFFCKLFREGHYFSPEMYFFVFCYVFVNLYESKQPISANPL